MRRQNAPGRKFTGKSIYASELDSNPSVELDYVVAMARMAYNMDYSRSSAAQERVVFEV